MPPPVCLALAVLLACATSWGQVRPGSGPAYLVYAGPYPSSPPSAFGHLFLLFDPGDGSPLPLWDAVSYGVETQDVGSLSYFVKGIVGGYRGSFTVTPFNRKSRDYQVVEDRDLWFVRLQLPEAQLATLIDAVGQSQSAQLPYSFFHRNCAYYVQGLLCQAIPAVPEPRLFTSPAGVISRVIKAGVAPQGFRRLSQSQYLAARFRDGARLGAPPSAEPPVGRRPPWNGPLTELTVEDRLVLMDLLEWRSAHAKSGPDSASMATLAMLRRLNATSAAPDVHEDSAADARSQDWNPGVLPPYGKLTAGWRLTDTGPRVSLRYRPAMHAVADPGTGYRPINTLELLAVEVSRGGRSTRVDEFILFSQTSLNPIDCVSRRRSWFVEAAARRGSVFGAHPVRYGLGSGLGRTYLHGRCTYFYALGTLGVQFVHSRAAALTPGLSMGACLIPSGAGWRLGTWATAETDASRPHRRSVAAGAWVRRDIGSRAGVEVTAKARGHRWDAASSLVCALGP